MGTILALIFICAAFFAGVRVGKRSTSHTDSAAQAKAIAWREGYDAAIKFAKQQTPPAQRSTTESARPVAHPLPDPPRSSQPSASQPSHNELPAQAIYGPPANRFPPVPVPQIVPTLSAEEQAAQAAEAKVRRELRNINVTLYVAALLIVSAAALFLSFALPPTAKLIALFFLTALAYGGGLVVHAAKKSLRPAATAFVGTGLALLPLSAIATYNTLTISGPSIWLKFSLIGTLAVGYATIRLRSQVLSWIAVLVLVSTTMAGAATIQRGVLYYLLLLLALSIVLLLLATRSRRLRESVFYRSVSSTAQLLPGLVLLLALVLLGVLSARDYLWIFFLLTLQLLLTVRLLREHRLLRLYAARLSAVLFVLAGCYYLDFSGSLSTLVLGFGLALQAVLVLLFGDSYRRKFALSSSAWRIERGVLWAATVACLLWTYLDRAPGVVTWPLNYVVVPVFLCLTLPALARKAKIEVVALVLLSVLPLADFAADPWRMLPSLMLGILFLSLTHYRSTAGWQLVLGHARFALVLCVGVAVTRSIATFAGQERTTELMLASIVGLWVPALGYWVADLRHRRLVREPQATHLVGRMGVGALLLVLGLSSLRSNNLSLDSGPEFLGLSLFAWFTLGLLATTLMVLTSGWILSVLKPAAQQNPIRGISIGLLVLLYLYSFVPAHWWLALLVAVLLIGHALAEARRVRQRNWTRGYVVLAQLSFSSGLWWLVERSGFDHHGQFVFLILSVLIPQLARMFLAWRSAKGLSPVMRYLSIALLVLVPLSTAMYALVGQGADRGVLLVVALLVGSHGTMVFLADPHSGHGRQFYLGAPIIALVSLSLIPAWSMRADTGWIHTPWWTMHTALLMLAVLSLVALGAEWFWRQRDTLRFATGLGIGLPLLVMVVLSPSLGWLLLLSLILAVSLTLMVHTRSLGLYALGAGFAIFSATYNAVQLWLSHQVITRMDPLDLSWVLLGTALLLFLLAAFHGRFAEPLSRYPQLDAESKDPLGEASRIYFGLMLVAVLCTGVIWHVTQDAALPVIAGAGLIVAVAVSVRHFELPAAYRSIAIDGIIALTCLLNLSSYAIVESTPKFSSIIAYVSFVFVVLTVWREVVVLARLARIYTLIASALASLCLLATVADGNSLAQIYGLVFFAGLIAWGLKMGERLYIWWGAIAITLSVLWMLCSLAFLWLVFLGFGLIIAAVLKLVKVDAGAAPPEVSQEPSQTRGPDSKH